MKFSAPLLVAAAAAGVSAHPSGHNHAHNLAHRSAQQFVKYVQPAPEPSTTAQPPPPPPAAPTTEAKEEPAPSPEPEAGIFKEQTEEKKPERKQTDNSGSSSGGEGQGVSSYTPFCGGSKSKRATVAEIAYTGNVGSDGQYGCNMMLAQASAAKEYKYKAKIMNELDEEQHCVGYLKIGPKGLIDGFFKGNQALDFTIPAKGTQYVVVDENTQGGIICDSPSVPVANFGEWASTWAEFDFGNESNDQWSGADASSLVASRQGLNIPGMQICGPCDNGNEICSEIWPGGKGKNAFTAGMEAEDGWGLNCVAGPLQLDIKVGWSG